jgi:hypothetical protein
LSCFSTDCRDCCESRVEGAPTDGASPTAAPAISHDPVNQPAHYTWLPDGIQVLDITQHLNFCLGNVVKYVLRCDYKGDPLKDLRKAETYLRTEIARRERSAQ